MGSSIVHWTGILGPCLDWGSLLFMEVRKKGQRVGGREGGREEEKNKRGKGWKERRNERRS